MAKPYAYKIMIGAAIALAALFMLKGGPRQADTRYLADSLLRPAHEGMGRTRPVEGKVLWGDTFAAIFTRQGMDLGDLYAISKAAEGQHNMADVVSGRPYKARVDMKGRVTVFSYQIDQDYTLEAVRTEQGFECRKMPIDYERKVLTRSGVIKTSLYESMPTAEAALAVELSDIFAWDIDFTSDIRVGDSYTVMAEALYLEGKLVRWGRILSAKFVNNGVEYRGYRYELEGKAGYYDREGKSLVRTLLKAPLSYRRISSGYSGSRYHPILKIFRPHLAVDYSAAQGTPVSSVGEGTVLFAGYKGQNGNMVSVKHSGGYVTYYGHLQKIMSGIRAGAKVRQGQVIGTVGSTGLSTGPHLDYRMQLNGRFVNPLKLMVPKSASVPGAKMAEYRAAVAALENQELAISKSGGEMVASVAPATVPSTSN